MNDAAPQRIAIVVQRYGAEINGGAELHARLLAQALKPHYAVDVLTSRALSYRDWDHHYPAGESWLDGCRVVRFDHPPRDRSRRKHMPLGPKLRFKLRDWLSRRGSAPLVGPPTADPVHDGERYLRAQGPTMDGLLDYLRDHGDDYTAIIFVSALYHHSALGLLAAPRRAILVPTLHDEKAMYLPHFHRLFRAPRWIMYNTAGERATAHRLYGSDIAPGEVSGVGIGNPAATTTVTPAADPRHWTQTADRLGLTGPFLLYVGRIERGKGCAELFDQFARFKRDSPSPLKLVVCGQLFMPAPRHPDIVLAGFVSDAERDELIAHALALVIPSRYESLSLVLLESLDSGCPVIVNRDCEVLRQHVQDSSVGRHYNDAAGFAAAVRDIQGWSAETRAEQAARGRAYVRSNYDWPIIVAKYRRAIDALAKSSR